MRIDKQLVKSQTITFICVVVFIVIFKTIFGDINTLIGVTTVTAALMLLERDLTLNPFKNTFKFIGINLLIGLGSMLASSNMYLGTVVNFSILFTISYIFCSNLRNPMYVPFSLQYLFLLATPVTGNQVFIRLLALITGAIVIMLAQLVANRNRLAKSGNLILGGVCDLIISKLEHTDENMDDFNRNKSIHASIDTFRSIIYDKREYNYYLTEEGRLKLNISVALENINAMLTDENISHIDKDILDTLNALIKEVKLVLDNSKEDKESNDASSHITKLLEICEDKNISDLLNLQLLDSMLLLSDTVDTLKKLDVKEFDFINKKHDITELFSDDTLKSFFVDKKSLKFCYAMRLAITISVGGFIMDYFNLAEGRWILFTIFSLTNPLYEVAKSKSKERVLSTLIGSIIIVFLFSIFKDTTSRMIIIMMTGYLQGYFKEYKYSMIFITVSAIGSAALVDNVQILTLNRIIFVLVGAILSILANKFIFPYKLTDSINHLKHMYHACIIAMLREIYNLIEGEKRPTHMKNLIVLTSLIDAKARTTVSIVNSPSYNDVITERRNLVANIYELYILLLVKEITYDNQKQILSDINDLIEHPEKNIDTKIKDLKYGIKVSKNINTKIILSSITVILKELNHLDELNKKLV
ncbi:MAG: FUSC family protein [Terrisporobacter sp.]|uniref:FUSC family protein n=1 Tax=Terrisporobacter sp. TaxID=1965305 RepID=UPI002FC9F8FE